MRRWIAGAVLCAALCGAAPAAAAPPVAVIKAKVDKPLGLSWVQDLNFGTLTLAPGTWAGATIRISRSGAFTCASPNVTCTGLTQAAQYNVTGSNNQVVRVSAPNVTLVNQADPAARLTLVIDSPGTVTLSSSGKKGTNFSLGGAIDLSSSTPGGVYTGTFNVTVDY
jgi:hypothetical protein